MEAVTEVIRAAVLDSLKKRKHSDNSSQGGDSPKRRPPSFSMDYHKDTPDWAKDCFSKVAAHLIQMDQFFSDSLEFATEAAVKSLAKVGEFQCKHNSQQKEITNLNYQLGQLRSELKDQGQIPGNPQ